MQSFQQYVNAAGYECRDSADIRPIATDKPPKLATIEKPRVVFRQFASISSPEACAIFATEYGLLGFAGQRAPNEEDVHQWLWDAQKAKWTLEFWQFIKRRQYRKLPAHYAAIDNLRDVMNPAGAYVIFGNDGPGNIDKSAILGIPPTLGPVRIATELRKAQAWLDTIVSTHLQQSVGIRIYQGRIVLRPLCLMGAMWLGFAEEVIGAVDTHICEYEGCGKLFSRGPKQDRRANAKTCSNKCGWNLWNHTRRARPSADACQDAQESPQVSPGASSIPCGKSPLQPRGHVYSKPKPFSLTRIAVRDTRNLRARA